MHNYLHVYVRVLSVLKCDLAGENGPVGALVAITIRDHNHVTVTLYQNLLQNMIISGCNVTI